APVASEVKPLGRLESGQEKEFDVLLALNKPISSALGDLKIQVLSPGTTPSASDNVMLVPVQVTLRMPDLVIGDAKINEKGFLVFFVYNKGTMMAGPSQTALYINGALTQRYATFAI